MPAAKSLKRCESETLMNVTQMSNVPDRLYDHERSCVRRAEVVKYRGISLLNEVDAQYSALQVKYEELLRRCHLGGQEKEQEAQSHKAVQTAMATSPPSASSRPLSPDPAQMIQDLGDELHQPEYKALFKEIFTCIQKTKEGLIENRGTSPAGEIVPLFH